ncbi:enoyl-CoA hydratase-related protein [Streptomyces sp. JNUCC 63]
MPNQAGVLRAEIGHGVAHLRWEAPHTRNAIGRARADELSEELERLAGDDAVAVVTLGLGQRPFCSGWDSRDLAGLAGADEQALAGFFTHGRRLLAALSALPQPTVAAVGGAALGFGAALLSRCDLVLAADDALFGLPEIARGFPPATVAPELLAVMPAREVRAWALSGQAVTAARAAEAGLVHRCCPAEEVDAVAAALAAAMAQYGPEAVRATKRLVGDLAAMPEADRSAFGVRSAVAQFSRAPRVPGNQEGS